MDSSYPDTSIVDAVERGAAHGVGGDVDDGVRAGERIELDGRDRPEGAFAGGAVAVGKVEGDAVGVDGDERRALGGLVTSQVGKCHAGQP